MQNAHVLALFLCLGTTILFAQKQTPDWKTESRQTKLSVDLLQTRQAYRQHLDQRGRNGDFHPGNAAVAYAGGAVQVEVITRSPAAGLLLEAGRLGMTNLSAFGYLLNGSISLDKLDQLAGLPEVVSVSPVYDPVSSVGLATTQGDRAQRTHLLRQVFRVDGTGVKVGVLSDSYNYLGGAAASVAAGDLPGPGNPNGYTKPIDILADNSNTDEGRAMLEIIHDIAPAAELAFHTAKGGTAAFAQGIIDLARKAHCDVIVDDIVYRTSPWFQDGAVAQAVDSVRAMGVSYFTSAGNQGKSSYEEAFTPAQPYRLEFNNLGRAYSADITPHDFAPGDHQQAIRIPRGGSLSLVLQWTDRYPSISGQPGAASDLDFFLLSADGRQVLAASTNNNSTTDPLEILSYTNQTSADIQANLMIGLLKGPAPSLIKYISYGSLRIDEYFSGAATCIGHANANGAITVGATGYQNTPEFGSPSPFLQSYSSEGGTPIVRQASGNRPEEAILRNKPNIIAPDGVDNSFFGADSDGSGQPNFFGTSAAAPHAAALAALLLDLDESLTPDDIRQALERTALDMGTVGFNYDSGWGLVNGFAAALQEARYAAAVHLSGTETNFPDRRFAGNGTVTTDMEVRSRFQLTSATAIRLQAGFKAARGTVFTARIDPAVRQDRPLASEPEQLPLELREAPAVEWPLETARLISGPELHAYPNPFRGPVRIDLRISDASEIALSLLDASGRVISRLASSSVLSPGAYAYDFDGAQLPAGTYYLVLDMEGQRITEKLVRL